MQPQPKRMRHHPPARPRSNPLPGHPDLADNQQQFTGLSCGHHVEVRHPDHIRQLQENGCFGVATKSDGSTTDDMSSDAQLGADGGTVLALFNEEAFFLHHTLRCLELRRSGSHSSQEVLSTEEFFEQACRTNRRFVPSYLAYKYLRAMNWVVKEGTKFAGQFLLYKDGPHAFHANYIVLVRTASPDAHRTPRLDVHEMQGHYRIAEAAKKELLIVDVTYPSDLDRQAPAAAQLAALDRFLVDACVVDRFNLNRERVAESSCD